MKMFSGSNASPRLARRRLGRFSGGSWGRGSSGGVRRTRGRRRVLQCQVRAVEGRVLRSRSDHDGLNGIAPALKFCQRQADAERSGELLSVHFRGSQQRSRIHLQSIPEKDQSCAKRISAERFFVFPFLRIVSLEENIERLALRKQASDARDDCFAIDLER